MKSTTSTRTYLHPNTYRRLGMRILCQALKSSGEKRVWSLVMTFDIRAQFNVWRRFNFYMASIIYNKCVLSNIRDCSRNENFQAIWGIVVSEYCEILMETLYDIFLLLNLKNPKRLVALFPTQLNEEKYLRLIS